MIYGRDTFDAICTSATYGNRMADHHDPHDLPPLLRTRRIPLTAQHGGRQPRHDYAYPECEQSVTLYADLLRTGRTTDTRHTYRHASRSRVALASQPNAGPGHPN